MKELDKAKMAADCFMVLWNEEIITTSNVIAMQFLLQEIKCEELERKCVEYAKNRTQYIITKSHQVLLLL